MGIRAVCANSQGKTISPARNEPFPLALFTTAVFRFFLKIRKNPNNLKIDERKRNSVKRNAHLRYGVAVVEIRRTNRCSVAVAEKG